ncbi:hypothetical protein PVAND_004481 [Polypedilum vanderplanki]|uniref:Transport and Golgi organization protein 1 n=1 Tax=Polypedilum vanderplanki TaxID=319348 RepID=A0A9J6BXB9_POLVA|nr:hypothetical protein PVAND_004481 [Polypedilum vanderplanki]
MRLKVIILLSVLGYSFGERLQVKCGDELCEKPSNRAVTTLRYTPDKPYKLQINSVNSEVDIFGATDDLFYIRYGRNYGFLPKNHLREKARGNFLHSVEIDIASLKINQEVRETNYLHEFIKSSSQTSSSDPNKNINDNSNETKESENQKNKEIKAIDDEKSEQEERPKDFIPIGIEPKIESASIKLEDKSAETVSITKEEKENDSGVEEEDDEEEGEDTNDEDEEEDEEREIFNKKEQKNDTLTETTKSADQPELIAIPPSKNVVEEVPANVENVTFTQEEFTKTVPEQELNVAEEKIQSTTDIPPINEQEKFLEEKSNDLQSEKNETQSIDEQKKIQDEQKPKEEQIKTEINKQEENEIQSSPSAPVNDEIKPVKELFDDSTEVVQRHFHNEANSISETHSIDKGFEINHLQEPLNSSSQISSSDPDKNINDNNNETEESMNNKNEEIKVVDGENLEQEKLNDLQSEKNETQSIDEQQKIQDESLAKEEQVITEINKQEENKIQPGPITEGIKFVRKLFSDSTEAVQKNSHEEVNSNSKTNSIDEGFCEKIDSENCPKSFNAKREVDQERVESVWMTSEEYIKIAMHEAIERMDLIITMALTAVTVLIFTFGYYCINKARKEGPLLAKMNDLERHLMASVKENEMLKGEIVVTKQKLVSIENNSFGSNDMVIALKNDLEINEREKLELQEKISSLEKELEAAAEDGLELNRMVSELLSSQTGSDSIISSVEDLQRQLNEQQDTILTMNETIAAKSRENTELQIQLSEINGKFNGELEKMQQTLDAVILERNNLQIELENLKRESDIQVNQIIEERNGEVTRLNKELTSYAGKYDETKKLLNTSEAKVQALEECIETFKKGKGGSGDVKALLDVADLKADLLAVTKEKSTIQEQLQTERDSRKLLEDRVKTISEEMSNLKKEFVTADKEKHEAQTRLEVLSTYFKEKETQLQQELSVKEARWMKQQGEKTSTVEKIQALNDEIQTLKSQNDALRAEIEAQAAAHKLNITATETQAHTAWLNARQAERKLEESRMEAAALRRRLTSIAENPAGASDLINGLPGVTNDSVPSPIRVESPNNVNVNQIQPGPPLMMPPPPPFLPGANPFLPPFLPPGELPPLPIGMPPPLGRLMSPPPKRFTPTMRDDRDRYSPRGARRYSPDFYDDYTATETNFSDTDYSPPRTPTPPRRGYNSPTDRSKKSKDSNQQRRK